MLGKSGRAMIKALIAGERDPDRLAGLARGVLRRKTGELAMACDGRFTAGHGQMCRLHLDAYDHLTAKIAELDALVAEAAAPFAALIARLITIPGIGQRTAEVIIAETGGDMTRFPTAARLAAWAGLAPGDNESAGKRKKAPARQGNPHLRTAMVEAAWAT
jgi:transposase